MIGLDTSAIIDIFRGEKGMAAFLKENQEPMAVTIFSYLELFFGLDPDNVRHQEEARYYNEFFQEIYSIDLSKQACQGSSKIFWELKKRGKSIEEADCVIAAIFLHHGITKIVTRNVKHFKQIPQLQVVNY
ncbi:MAG TPA: type II toxin-antitoxin system VapC family toxin [Candidatus Nanoarchaeia archaeon]|nr:type II toxin-antitoxin system VapC family toxin [Candidatus Nanoarchaeia archaeon]